MLSHKLIVIEGLEDLSSPSYEELSADKASCLLSKMANANEIERIIDIFIEELQSFPSHIKNESIESIELYGRELVFGSKYIADFFYLSKNIYNKLVLKLYQLTKAFISKSDLLIKLFKDIHNSSSNIAKDSDEVSNNNEKVMKEITSKDFNIFNKIKLYKIILEEIEHIFNETHINQLVSLSNYLDIFDNMSEANFTPFSLVETYDYEYFYNEESEEDVSKDKLQMRINITKSEYIQQFTNITNTNFFSVISTISNESVRVDYRKKIVDYFHAFLLSSEGSVLSKLETLLCIIDKMLFYDGEETQSTFSKVKYEKFFFPNINNLLHENIIYTIVSTKIFMTSNGLCSIFLLLN